MMPSGRPKTAGRSFLFPLLAVAALAVALLTQLSLEDARADYIYQPYGTWNGKKIYLSPARHSDAGGRGECQGTNENHMAFNEAWYASNGAYYNDVYNPNHTLRNLRARHYRVRVGTGTVASAIENSNAWGANRHIPIHSNADVANQCGRTNASRFGTVGIYWNGSPNGRDLARELKNTIGTYSGRTSPGTNDFICYNPGHPCTTITLGELRYTNAPAAYMETEFHTWNRGVNWLLDSRIWGWRFGWAIDVHMGYPR
jgi:hypothetical protein